MEALEIVVEIYSIVGEILNLIGEGPQMINNCSIIMMHIGFVIL